MNPIAQPPGGQYSMPPAMSHGYATAAATEWTADPPVWRIHALATAPVATSVFSKRFKVATWVQVCHLNLRP